MKKNKNRFFLRFRSKCLLLILILTLTFVSSAVFSETALEKRIKFFSSLPTRIPGTQSYNEAADYIYGNFISAGLKTVTKETFSTVVPSEKESYLLSGSMKISLQACWPNSVRTCTTGRNGITGKLIFYDSADPSSINGKDITGNIVVMDFNSGTKWLDFAGFGAKAVIFIEPQNTNRAEAEKKFLSIPLNIPRFYVRQTVLPDIEKLSKTSAQVTLCSQVDWISAPSYNIYGFLEGKDAKLKDDLIVIEAYYDSMSVVPSLAPGAESSCGISLLLDMLDQFKSRPPARSILFLACSSHFEAMRGMDDFIQRHLRTIKPFKERIKVHFSPKLVFCLDITTQSDQVAVWHNTYDFNSQRFFAPVAKKIVEYGKEVCGSFGYDPEKSVINGVSPEKGMTWSNFMPGTVKTDGEYLIHVAIPAVSLITVNDARNKIDTPFDRINFLDFANLKKQANILQGICRKAFDDPEFLEKTELQIKDNLCSLTCKAVTFNPKKSFVPNEPVANALILPRSMVIPYKKTCFGVRGDLLEMTGADGIGTISRLYQAPVFLQCFGIDPGTGEIILTSDFGINGDEQFPMRVNIDYNDKKSTNVLFECKAINLIGLVDPQYLIPLPKLDIFDVSNSLTGCIWIFSRIS